MKRSIEWFQKVENIVLVLTFSIMVFVSFIQVVNRNIFKIPVSGLEEASKYSMIYMVLLGTELGLRDGTQISVTAVVDMMNKKIRWFMQIISKLIVLIFSGVVFYYSIDMVKQQVISGQASPGLHLPMYIPYAALLISFGIITIVQFVLLLQMVRYKNDDKEVKL